MAKDKTLSIRVSEKTYAILRSLSGIKGNVSDMARETIEASLERMGFQKTAFHLLSSPAQSFGSILVRFLDHGCLSIGRADYLFLAYAIQQGTYQGLTTTQQRFLELLNLQSQLYSMFKGKFDDDYYLLSNLNAYTAKIERQNNVCLAIDRLKKEIESCGQNKTYSSDLISRNIITLIERSSDIGEDEFKIKASPYLETLITLASQGICKKEHLQIEQFTKYLYNEFTTQEDGGWFLLNVWSNASTFAATLEIYGDPGIVIPLSYPEFAELTSGNTLVDLSALGKSIGPSNKTFMLHLPAGGRAFLTAEQAAALSTICEKILSMQNFKPNNWILSLLHGVAE